MPSSAPSVKKNAVAGYGAIITECRPTMKDREDTVETIMASTHATLIHPYNNSQIIAGQGTLMLELLAQARSSGRPLDTIIVPVGGGGLLAGCSIAARGVDPSIRVFAAEPLAVDDAARAFASNTLMQNPAGATSVADGLTANLGALNFPIIMDNVDSIFTVTETQIVDAMRLVWERMKIVIEPSAATGVAVALFNEEFRRLEPAPRNIGIVLSGGNVDLIRALELFK
ncbi:tryptophan synthase beta subunit-like PLP-dependent enzyme [Jimgerdemannia flammicorona]|uniref:Tryptophan synthase beta subunit-like PLP-dependent enzyme n=1 Tax=Jimgerdemannia flammicorona TaxID=994334 RepID=A0A433DHT2_9FUNG|nr:tryptophan synthase beta subunit-like PLP-dependent enzyme [Jimgerdemannia flammicorona]